MISPATESSRVDSSLSCIYLCTKECWFSDTFTLLDFLKAAKDVKQKVHRTYFRDNTYNCGILPLVSWETGNRWKKIKLPRKIRHTVRAIEENTCVSFFLFLRQNDGLSFLLLQKLLEFTSTTWFFTQEFSSKTPNEECRRERREGEKENVSQK